MNRTWRVGFIVLAAITIAVLVVSSSVATASYEDCVVKRFMYRGKVVELVRVPGRPPRDFRMPAVNDKIPRSKMVNVLGNVPALDWSYGCSATSMAMMAGYYDRTNYPLMYTGSTGGGVFPLPVDSSIWGQTQYFPSGTWCMECPLSATRQGVDGRATKGHVDDYWIDYGNTGPDPFIGNWTEHTHADCTGDFMGTSQSNNGQGDSPPAPCADGSTWFFWFADGTPLVDYIVCEPTYRDGCHGMRLFAESRGYKVITNYSQHIYGWTGNTNGFTYQQFRNEIDAGRPVMIQLEYHSMVGYGYDDSANLVYIHDTWDHQGHTMVWGGQYGGYWHHGVTVLHLNTPPSVTSVAIAPDPAYTNTDLAATPVGWYDPDGDSPSYTWQWQKDTGGGFAPIPGATTNTLDHTNFVKGNQVKVICTPDDLRTREAGASVQDIITISNTAPTQPTVDVTPNTPNSDDTLHCGASGSTDLDGDPVTYNYQWYKNGVIRPARTWPNIAAWRTSVGDVWRCVVTPTDGTSNGLTGEDTVTVINRPPTAPTVVITPASPNSDDKLFCNASGSTDPDGQPVTYKYQWWKNGVLRPARVWPCIAASRTSPGDVWRCVVTPTDGTDDGPRVDDTVTVINRPPTAPTVAISPASPTTNDKLCCNASGSTDPDGDPVTYSYQWHKNSVLKPARVWPCIPAWRTSPGDTWRCVVTPNDGTDDGPSAEDTVTIAAAALVMKTTALGCLSVQPTALGAQVVFTLSGDAKVTAEVLNIAGRPVRLLALDKAMPAGTNILTWNGRSTAGLAVPSGIYLVRVTAAAEEGTRAQALATVMIAR